jgi:Heavy-metal resistance
MTETPPKERSWRRVALPLSLLLNLFLVALIAGHLLRRHLNEAGLGTVPLARALVKAEASLSPSDAAAFDAVIRRDAPRYAASARAFGQARRALERQILAQPFDRDAAREALAAWQASWNRFLDDFGGPLVDALAQVSPEGRQKLIAARRRASSDPQTPDPP